MERDNWFKSYKEEIEKGFPLLAGLAEVAALTLDGQVVDSLFRGCLFNANEDTREHVPAHGITMHVGFHPGRLEAARAKAGRLLLQLPPEFMESAGGGMSFLNACTDHHGRQWGQHQQMEQLFLLGMALGYVGCLLPPVVWAALPGGMPYYVVYDKRIPRQGKIL